MAVLSVLVWAGCAGSKQAAIAPDTVFGHRFTGRLPDGRVVLELRPPDSGAAYFFYPVYVDIDSLKVRHGALPADTLQSREVPVELVIKGAIPDACSELHGVSQSRTGQIIIVELTMRRPRGAVCDAMRRPFLYYLTLDSPYRPGSYTLKLNGQVYPFEIRPPSSRQAHR